LGIDGERFEIKTKPNPIRKCFLLSVHFTLTPIYSMAEEELQSLLFVAREVYVYSVSNLPSLRDPRSINSPSLSLPHSL